MPIHLGYDTYPVTPRLYRTWACVLAHLSGRVRLAHSPKHIWRTHRRSRTACAIIAHLYLPPITVRPPARPVISVVASVATGGHTIGESERWELRHVSRTSGNRIPQLRVFFYILLPFELEDKRRKLGNCLWKLFSSQNDRLRHFLSFIFTCWSRPGIHHRDDFAYLHVCFLEGDLQENRDLIVVGGHLTVVEELKLSLIEGPKLRYNPNINI